MNIRLKIASLWLPEFILKRELDNVAKKTIKGLNDVLDQYVPCKKFDRGNEILKGSLEERRARMAEAHNNRVKVLIEELGYKKAIKIGRKAMFKVGYQLGRDTGQRLGVGNSFKDLEDAAKILYKVLGIDFKIENKDGKMVMVVKRCDLSKYYAPETCKVLSAADEGVVFGLNENLDMKFKVRITEGASECIACINEVRI